MKKSVIISAILSLSVCTLNFAASLQSMDKARLMQMIAGKTMTTLIPRANPMYVDVFTIYFGAGGAMVGQFGNKPDISPQSDQGTWHIQSNGVLCATYQHWYQSKEMCFYVYEFNNSLEFVDQATNNFNNVVFKSNIQQGNQI